MFGYYAFSMLPLIFYFAIFIVCVWVIVRYFTFTKAMMKMSDEFTTFAREMKELRSELRGIKEAIEKTKENPRN